ncbi:MAG: 3-phosphoshikimate 1-carboxyvinyltransferase, partial [Candidatus Bipolaricaulia bacterium]
EISVINRRESANEPRADLKVKAAKLTGIEVGEAVIPRMIDELPLLAVVATQAEGRTVIREAAELRVKETDRIRATVASLKRLGAEIEELPDGMVIQGPAQLKGAIVDSEGDHRIVMANAVAALLARGQTTVRGAEWADVSFPGFFETLEAISIA